MKRKYKSQVTSHESRKGVGSALILTVVLTSLLAIVGVLFIMMARVNQIATSGLSESKELDAAIETVIAKISEELALDIPRKGPNDVELSEYYDYPDVNNAWLASLEPFKDDGDYYWRQISDVTGFLAKKGYNTQDVNVAPVGLSTTTVVREYPIFGMDSEGRFLKISSSGSTSIATYGVSADADGDGIADSKWIQLDSITSSKGKAIYAAIRIVDNGGMINVNTAHSFDPNSLDVERIDGSSQMQINLAGLLREDDTIDELHGARCGIGNPDWDSFADNVIWRYDIPDGNYLAFDISDELELRYRYCIDSKVISRFEANLPDTVKGAGTANFGNLYDTSTSGQPDNPCASNWRLIDWQRRITEPEDCKTDRRHYLTIYNMDRIIDPNGVKMTNVSDANIDDLYLSIRRGLLDTNYPDVDGVAAQIAVNLKDYVDGDSNVRAFVPDVNGPAYYGFERPCVYISELACRLKQDSVDPDKYYRSYAVELYKPYSGDDNPDPNWQLVISNPNSTTSINWSVASPYHVIKWEALVDPCVPLDVNVTSSIQQHDNPDTNSVVIFDGGSTIYLERLVDDVNYIVVDSKPVPDANGGWLAIDGNPHSIQRDIKPHKCIRRLWDSAEKDPALGQQNNFVHPDANEIQAHPYLDPSIYGNQGFKNIGEIGMIFRKSAYIQGPSPIGPTDTEATARINLAEPSYQNLFQYLTVFDPYNFDANYVNETRIKGRININTAPWYVLAQLPWMQYTAAGDDYQRAQEIANNGPYENIGELMRVAEMRSLNLDDVDNLNTDAPKGPDLTEDTAQDDFEERDLILTRISNLVTVRSDVFTAYILVRIGTDGPQKRVIAILDRSDVYSPTDKVKVVVVHPVADPR